MQLTLQLNIDPIKKPVSYTNKIMLIGSCFTENMSERLNHAKFQTLSNPHGILFNPVSVTDSLNSYIDNKAYAEDDLFYLNELWNSWDHHTRFSHINKAEALKSINASQEKAANYIREADYLVITLGSAFQYYLKDTGKPVANNHRAPAQWFEKRLLPIDLITASLSRTLEKLYKLNPGIQIIFTISPVRHIRDGVIDNNRSKARLIEAVHTLCSSFDNTYYFPAYELVIDILRDYRYYDIDFVHPNYLATSFIWEHFVKACISNDAQHLMKELQEISTARAHRTRFPQTEAHARFMANYAEKVKQFIDKYPYLQLNEELTYFSSNEAEK